MMFFSKTLRLFFLCLTLSGILILSFMSLVFAEENNKYVVTLKENNEGLAVLSEMNLEIINEELNIYEVDEKQLKELEKMGAVLEAEKDVPLTLFDEDSFSANDTAFENQWYYDSQNIGKLKNKANDGEGVRIAIIDTGIAKNHSDIDYSRIVGGYNFLDDNEDYYDTNGHGTNVAGVITAINNNEIGIAGIAPKAELVIFRVVNGSKSSSAAMLKSIQSAVEDYDCDIINISLGTYAELGSAYQRVIDLAYEKGVLIFAAVGNDGANSKGTSLSYPAANDHVIGIGNADEDLLRATTSQKNKSVFALSAGKNIHTTALNDNYTTTSGTSFSSPITAAVFALLKGQFSDLDYDLAVNAIKAGTIDRGEVGYDVEYGYGVIDAMGLYDFLNSDRINFISPYINNNTSAIFKAFSEEESGVIIFEIFENDKPTQITYKSVVFEDKLTAFEESFILNDNQRVKLFLIKDFDSLNLLTDRE